MMRFLVVKLGRAMEHAGYEFGHTPDMPPPITVDEVRLQERIRDLSMMLISGGLSPEQDRARRNQLYRARLDLSVLENRRLSRSGGRP